MPTSNLAVAPAVVHLVETAGTADRILEIGPGYGKYGLLLREYLNRKPSVIDAVEAWGPYVDAFPWLQAVYDHVDVGDATSLTAEQLAPYDLVLMADVIEHMDKPSAIGLLDRIGGAVVVSTPEQFFPSVDYPPTERHVSHWTRQDFGGRVEADASLLGGLIVRLAPAGAST